MKIKIFGFLLLALFVVSSLEAVWADEDFDIDELAEFDGAVEEDVDELGATEEDEISVLSKRTCMERNKHYDGKCLNTECKKLCKVDGYKKSKCTKSKSDKVKRCYCIKPCDKKDDPISPATPPSDAPPADVTPTPSSAPVDPPADLPPTEAPNSINSFEEEAEDSDGAVEDDVDELGVTEEDEISVLSKRKRICLEKNKHYVGKCLKTKCKKLCKLDGYKKSKCTKSKSDKVKSCYCIKPCIKPCYPVSPASPPSDMTPTPAASPADLPPTEAPNSINSFEEEAEDSDGAIEDDVDELGVTEEDEISVLSKRKRICVKKNKHHVGKCLKTKCKKLCKLDGYKKSKCTKSKSDKVKSCYCIKPCRPVSPASPPSDITPTPAASPADFPPTKAPNSINSFEEEEEDDSEIIFA